MKIFVRLLSIFFSVSLGLIFIYSGYTKLYPVIEPFEMSFIDLGIANWYTAPIIARIVLALEFFTGLLLLMNYNLKKFTLPLTFVLLLFFIVYLVYQILDSGNNVSCGCFGIHHRMSPAMAIVKNLVMSGLGLFIYFFYEGWKVTRNYILTGLLAMSTLSIPFLINPVDYTYTSNNQQEKVNYPLELDLLYHPEDTGKVDIPQQELRKGKQVLAFLSLSCVHCKIAAQKFGLIKKQNPEIPIYFVLNGKKEKYPDFVKEAKTQDIPYSFCNGETFMKLASASLPRIYYLDNGIVVKKVDYIELSKDHIETWIYSDETVK